MAVVLAITELSDISVALGVGKSTLARTHSLAVFALIGVAVLELIHAAAVHEVVLPIAGVGVTVAIAERTFSLPHVAYPMTVV